MHACPFQPLHPPSRKCTLPRWMKLPSGSCCEAASACSCRPAAVCTQPAASVLHWGSPRQWVASWRSCSNSGWRCKGASRRQQVGAACGACTGGSGCALCAFHLISLSFALRWCAARPRRPALWSFSVRLLLLGSGGAFGRFCAAVKLHSICYTAPRLRIGQHWHIHAVRHCAVAPASLCLTACQAAGRRCCPHRGAA